MLNEKDWRTAYHDRVSVVFLRKIFKIIFKMMGFLRKASFCYDSESRLCSLQDISGKPLIVIGSLTSHIPGASIFFVGWQGIYKNEIRHLIKA
jgi:hypothetical protein